MLRVFSLTHDGIIQALGYYQRNGERMRYGEFRAKGLCISGAVVEAGCKIVIGTRLKIGGMHWSVRGTSEIAALRNWPMPAPLSSAA